jgi:hypothetical protein
MELNWKNAKAWMDEANKDKEEWSEPCWSWDCNFKLDLDGSLISVSSRFYPPSYNVKDCWTGTLQIYILKELILKEEIECDTLDQLKEKAESFIKNYANEIKLAIESLTINISAGENT